MSLMPVLPPGEVAALLKDRIARLDREAEAGRRTVDAASRQGVERLFLIEAEYLLAMRQAERDFVDRLLGLIQRSPAFTRTWADWHAKRRRRSGPTS